MKSWLHQHREAAADALRRLAAAPLTTVLGALVLGIALALPAAGELVRANLLALVHGTAARPQISLFMALGAARKDAADIEARLRGDPQVAEVRFVAREEALRRFKSSDALGGVIEGLARNPFPDALVVSPRNASPAALDSMKTEFARLPKVEHVQLDSALVRKLDALLRLARLAVGLLAGLLGVAVVAATFSAIRLQVLGRSEEIELSRLLGATDAFVRRPLCYLGAFQGLAGGFVAWIVVFGCVSLLRPPVAEAAALYGVDFSLRGQPLLDAIAMIGAAVALGWLGARLSVRRYLREPARD